MAVKYDVLSMIDSEMSRASAPKSSSKPIFLFLRDGEKALIRPLFNLSEVLVMPKHNRWSEMADQRVNAVCAVEQGKTCAYCEASADDKKLNASTTFFVPVYVYSVTNTQTGQQVTFKDENQQEKPVSGFRVLELSAFGRISSVLKTFRSYFRDEDDHNITACDFSIEQAGAGTKKDFITTPKAPKAMNPGIKAACPTIDRFRASILEKCPPLVSADDDLPFNTKPVTSNAGSDFELDENGIAVF